MKIRVDDLPYSVWYDPEFPIAMAKHKHVFEVTGGLREFVDKLKEDIVKNGLLNPVFVQCGPEAPQPRIHPGKCRVVAWLELGHETIPAIIYDKFNRKTGITPTAIRVAPWSLGKYLKGDVGVKWTDRGMALTKVSEEWFYRDPRLKTKRARMARGEL